MATIADVKKDMEFYQDFGSLIEALKSITVAQFHTLEKKIKTFDEFASILESFFHLIDLKSVWHPFVQAQVAGVGVVAITSDAGLLGGFNNRIMHVAMNYLRNPQNKLIVVGSQGKRIAEGFKVSFEFFTGAEEGERHSRAVQIRNYIIEDVLYRRLGALKVIYAFAPSITNQKIVEYDLLPCTEWPKDHTGPTGRNPLEGGGDLGQPGLDYILESPVGSIIEYLAYLWIGQRLFEILQFSRLAEYAARFVHLEESSQKIKDLDEKLRLQYFRVRHGIIDQQMRELFAARSLYARK
ncbi:F0F1 ATP synthase subunit gamma [Candidatus Omnitrophota bacterium]